jgi:hypothetical protein
MNTQTILAGIIDWAGHRNITIAATERSIPPAELDMRPLLTPSETDCAGAGIHILIDAAVNGGPNAQISFWIPNSLKKGTWTPIAETDDEIPLYWIPQFSSEKEFVAFMDQEVARFFLRHIQEATLDEWLADHGYSYEVVSKPEFCGDAASLAESLDLENWLIVGFTDSNGYGVTLGVSGWGNAAIFYTNEDGFLTFDRRGEKLRNSRALVAWLESVVNIGS